MNIDEEDDDDEADNDDEDDDEIEGEVGLKYLAKDDIDVSLNCSQKMILWSNCDYLLGGERRGRLQSRRSR